ncbi:hypothetical protein OAN04_05505 [Candidatus Pelagibacter ubique]|nr:hypothetical protein [Candidatus Pelagibacter ubique]
MNIFKLLHQSKLALTKESELELAYLFGEHLKDIEYMKLKKPFYSGIFLQILAFFGKVLFNLSFFSESVTKNEIFLYSGSLNQFNSSISIVKSLRKNKYKFNHIINKNLDKKNLNYETIRLKFSFKVFSVAIILFLTRFLSLYSKLKKKNRIVQISWYSSLFCEAYSYVPYFLDLLTKAKPKIVIVSNDHSLNCRSLRLAAEMLGIKTLYLQHASVSNIFPPLEFDFALLDGSIAYKTYLSCYKKNKITNRIKKNAAKSRIILTGQKKIIHTNLKKFRIKTLQVGLAINTLDDFSHLSLLLNNLSLAKVKCSVRLHPNQDLSFVKELKKYMKNKNWIIFSDSKKQSVNNYLKNLDVLIAGNSSIHLEASLAGLPTFYYEMSDNVIKPDYYNYVKNGITKKLKNNFTFQELKNLTKKMHNDTKRQQAIKKYSETYQTHWQNKEGELTQEVIKRILNNQSLNDLFQVKSSRIYNSVYYPNKIRK